MPASASPAARPSVVWLIVDGAAAWAVRDLLASGHLPNLAEVAERGGWWPAVPAQPPCSTPAGLATLLTGRGPAEHGIWGRSVPTGPLSSASGFSCLPRTGDFVWDTLAGGVGVAQLPWATARALPQRVLAVNGFAATPDSGWRTAGGLNPSAHAALGPTVDPRIVAGVARDELGRPDHGELLEAAARLAAAAERASSVLAAHGPRTLIAYQPCADVVSHEVVTAAMVTGADRSSPEWRLLTAAYQLADAHLGQLIRTAAADASVIVSSDHGMDAKSAAVQVNQALAEAGLVRITPSGTVDLDASRIYFHPAEHGALTFPPRLLAGRARERRRVLEEAEAALCALRCEGRPVIDGLIDGQTLGSPFIAAWIRAEPGVQLRARGAGETVARPRRPKGFHQLYTGNPRLLGVLAMCGPVLRSPASAIPARTAPEMPVDNRRVRRFVESAASLSEQFACLRSKVQR